jgi:hypothetical protein
MSIGKPPNQTFWKVVAADIIAFDQHKNAMLNDLIKAYESGRNANAFDAIKRGLISLASPNFIFQIGP